MIGNDQFSAGTLAAESGFGEKFDGAFRKSAFVGNSNLEHNVENSLLQIAVNIFKFDFTVDHHHLKMINQL